MRNNNFGFFVAMAVKNLQFRYNTWKQGREIARAYGRPKPVQLDRRAMSAAIITIAAIIFSSIVYFSAPYVSKAYYTASAIIKKQTAKIEIARKAETIRRAMIHEKKKNDENIHKKSQFTEAITLKALPTIDSSRLNPETDTVKRSVKAPFPDKFITKTMDYCIIVNKAGRTMYLLNNSDEKGLWKIVEKFSILVGRNVGQKMTEGDKRTPEGTYFVIGRKETEELDAIYGPLVYMLNYPNEEDRRAGRTGQGIWIHGTREDTTREATRGCVVLNNKDIINLSGYLQLGIGTPVIIVNDSGLTEPQKLPNTAQLAALRERILSEYDSRQSEFGNIVMQWKQAWESRNIDSYSEFYDSDKFSGEGMRWGAWRDKKQRIFEAYNTISVEVDKLCVSEFSETTAVVMFVQSYNSKNLHIQKPKKLSFMRSDGRWKIFKEETFSRQELLL
jgi:murein L,D-transpeptidase YafK